MMYHTRAPANTTWPVRVFDVAQAEQFTRRLWRLFPSFRTRLRNLVTRRRHTVQNLYRAQQDLERTMQTPSPEFEVQIRQRDQDDFFDDPSIFMMFFWILPIDLLPHYGVPVDYVGLDGGPRQLTWHRPRLNDRMDFGLVNYPTFCMARATASGRVWLGQRH